MAYIGLAIFVICTLYLVNHWISDVLLILLATLALIFLLSRLRILPTSAAKDKAVAWLTFSPIIIVAIAAAIFPHSLGHSTREIDVGLLLFPDVQFEFGYGVIGLTALTLANAVWQFIDISALQRLQSLKITSADEKENARRGIYATGLEAGGGWVIIIIGALALKAQGLDDASKIAHFLTTLPDYWPLLLPLLVFSVMTFMLSTISGFVSAIAFVSYYDILGLVQDRHNQSDDSAPTTINHSERLLTARITSLAAIILLFTGYQGLVLALSRLTNGSDYIAQALYAIYAFQLSIAPSVLYCLLSKRVRSRTLGGDGFKISPLPIVVSVVCGLWLAVASATAKDPWFQIPIDSWYVSPPLFVLGGAFTAFTFFQAIVSWLERNHANNAN